MRREHDLDRGTHTLRVIDHGGEGRTLILIHGGGDSSNTWEALLPQLTPLARVVAYDLLGHGRSTIPSHYRRRMLDQDIDAVRDWTSDSAPVLVGHSLGSGIALWAAHRWTDKPAGMVLLDGAPHKLHLDGYVPRDPAVVRADLTARGYLEPHLSFFVDMATVDQDEIPAWTHPDLWFRVTVPTIALASTRGMSAEVRPRIHERLAQDPNPNLELRWVDAGHGVPEDRPDDVVTAVGDLLERLATPS